MLDARETESHCPILISGEKWITESSSSSFIIKYPIFFTVKKTIATMYAFIRLLLVMWKLYEIQISESTNQVLLAHCQTHSFLTCLWTLFCCKGGVEKLWQRPYGRQIPKHLHRTLSRKGLLTPVLNGYTIYNFSTFLFFFLHLHEYCFYPQTAELEHV